MLSERNRLIAWIIILAGVLYCLFSCSPVHRLNRFHKKHPYLFEAKTDTLLHRDTVRVVVPGVELDTSVHFRYLVDTVVIEKKGITTSVWQHGDTVYVKTKNDTVFIEVPYEVKVPYIKYVVDPPNKQPTSLILIPIFLLIFFMIYKKTD